MNSSLSNYPYGNDYSSQEILSDEEMRSRAAAYAQQVYEQQLEAYRQHREQILAARQAMAEYERQRRQYEDACRAYYAQQQAQSAVCVDPATGEQTFAFQRQYSAMQNAVPAAENSLESPVAPASVSEVSFEDSGVSEADESAEFSSETPEEVSDSEEAAGSPQEQNAHIPAAQTLPVGQRSSMRNFVAVFVMIVLLALLGAAGYIVFSNDPRFDVQRNNFFKAIGWENAIVAPRDNASSVPASSAPLPEFLPAKKSVSEENDASAESEAESDGDEIFEEE